MIKKYILTIAFLTPVIAKGMGEGESLSRASDSTATNQNMGESQELKQQLTNLINQTCSLFLATLPNTGHLVQKQSDTTAFLIIHHLHTNELLFTINHLPFQETSRWDQEAETWQPTTQLTYKAKSDIKRWERSLENYFDMKEEIDTTNHTLSYEAIKKYNKEMEKIYLPNKNKIIAFTLATGIGIGVVTAWVVNKICNSR